MRAAALLLGYLCVSVLTFGHSAMRCERSMCSNNAQRVVAGIVGGAFWPLYWSWELQEKWQ